MSQSSLADYKLNFENSKFKVNNNLRKCMLSYLYHHAKEHPNFVHVEWDGHQIFVQNSRQHKDHNGCGRFLVFALNHGNKNMPEIFIRQCYAPFHCFVRLQYNEQPGKWNNVQCHCDSIYIQVKKLWLVEIRPSKIVC